MEFAKKLVKHDIFIGFIFSVMISITVVALWFRSVPADEFLFMHDQAVFLSRHEIFSSIFVRSSNNFGYANGIIATSGLWHRLLYFFLYSTGLGTHGAEFAAFCIYIFTCHFLSFLGFIKISQLRSWRPSLVKIISISLFYTFNTFTLIFWHTGTFNYSAVITYSLFPLAFYFLSKLFEGAISNREIVGLAIILFFMSFYIPLFAVVGVFIILMFLIYLLRGDTKIKSSIINFFKLGVLFLPLASIVLITVFYEFFNIQGAINENPVTTFNFFDGGILSPLTMRFSWAIYYMWDNKQIFTFSDFFTSPFVLLSYALLFGFVAYALYKKSLNETSILVALFFLMLSLLLAKGAQEPFGEIFEILYNKVPFFKIFRSPDSKFGFGVVSSLSVFLLYIASHLKTEKFVTFMLFITFVQARPLISGEAIIGYSEKLGVDRVIKVPESYKKLVGFIEEDTGREASVLILPPNTFGRFKTQDGFDFIGQDLIKKIGKFTVVLINPTGGIYRDVYQSVEDSIKAGSIDILRRLGITHVLLRYDIYNPNYKLLDESLFVDIATLVYKDSHFTLYRFNNNVPIISGENITYTKISPIKYAITVTDTTKPAELTFLNSFHRGWHLFPNESSGVLGVEDLLVLVEKPVGLKKSLEEGYLNTWVLSQEDLNSRKEGNSNTATFTLYFKPQAYTYMGLLISGFTLVLYVFYLLRKPHAN